MTWFAAVKTDEDKGDAAIGQAEVVIALIELSPIGHWLFAVGAMGGLGVLPRGGQYLEAPCFTIVEPSGLNTDMPLLLRPLP
jgi:hypothetical protein